MSRPRERVEIAHYSDKLVEAVHSVEQQTDGMKPSGFWLSIEDLSRDEPDHWASWCEGENFPLGKYRYVVRLADDAKLLWLRSAREIDAFTKTYEIEASPPFYQNLELDWPAVAKSYQGIIIAPYQWSRRYTDHTGWYYGWDCASGCIWDAAAIASLALANQPSKEREG